MKLCRHCHNRKVSRPRGLCWRCYYTAGVQALYPPVDSRSRRGVPNFYGPAAPCRPTAAPPGTAAKVEVMARRAAEGQDLWHPGDGRR